MDNKTKEILVILLVILYIISPIDAFPGPIDDAIVSLIGVVTRKKLTE